MALLLLAPFYVAGWGAAAVIVAGRHVRAAVITGWEDVAGQTMRVRQTDTVRPARQPDTKQDAEAGQIVWFKRLFVVIGAGVLLSLLLLLGVITWVGVTLMVTHG